MKNNILLIENNIFSLNKNSLFFEGIIYTKPDTISENTIFFKESIFSLTLNENYTLTLKKLYSTLNIYYSEFINFSILIENKDGVKKLELNLTSYFLDFLESSLKNIHLEENDIISIKTKLFKLSRFKNKIYNKSSLVKTISFKILEGNLFKLEKEFINLKALSSNGTVLVSGMYSKNTDISISYLDKAFSIKTDDFGYFNTSIPLLPLGLNLKVFSKDSFPHEIKVTHSLTQYSLKNSITVYSIFNTPCKLCNISFDLYERKFKIKEYSSGILSSLKDNLFSFIISNETREVVFKKDFNGDCTEKDLIDTLHNLEFKESLYVSFKSSHEIFKFGAQTPFLSNITLFLSDKEVIQIIEPNISLDFNILNISSIYKNSTIFVMIDDILSTYANETGNLLISLSKNIKYNSKVTVWIEKGSFKTQPRIFHTIYKNKNKAFLFNTDLNVLTKNDSILKDISIPNLFFLTPNYMLPFYFFEEGYGRLSISTEINAIYTVYLLKNNLLEKIDTFTTNIQNKFKIPSNGIIFIDFTELQKSNVRVKILFKPLDICYKSLLTFNTRDIIKNSNLVFNDFLSFKKALINNSLTNDTLILSKYFSLYILNKEFFKDIDNSFLLFDTVLSCLKNEDSKEV